jgi:hypothetical protein
MTGGTVTSSLRNSTAERLNRNDGNYGRKRRAGKAMLAAYKFIRQSTPTSLKQLACPTMAAIYPFSPPLPAPGFYST